MLSANKLNIVGNSHIDQELFGGNLLAPRGTLLGDGSYSEAISELSVYGLRYPGGSLTEFMFDITDPDATEVIDERTGKTKTMIGLSDFLAYAEVESHPVTLVLPTRTQLSDEVDENGDRIPDIDEDNLRLFISDVASGKYGNASIAAFEIGNEHWGSGQMNAFEYGRLAAEMASIIDSELTAVGLDDIDVLVQKGNSFGYSDISDIYEGVPSIEVLADLNSKYDLGLAEEALFQNGNVNWTHIAMKLAMSGFDGDDKISAVDGLVTHIYSFGDRAPATRYFDLDQTNKVWVSEYPNLELHITEWNLKSTQGLEQHEDYGLFQAHEMLNIMEEFTRTGVDTAHVWPLIQNTKNPLAVGAGHQFDATTAAGEMFSLMAETLPGKSLIDLSPDSWETEAYSGDVAVHMFAGEGELALYIFNTSRDNSISSDINLSDFVVDFEQADLIVLGVEHGEKPGSNLSTPFIEELDPSIITGGQIEASLDPGEMMQVVLSNVTPTADFSQIWERVNEIEPFEDSVNQDHDDLLPVDLLLPMVDVGDTSSDSEEDSTGDDDLYGGLEWLFGLWGIIALGVGLGG